MSALLLAVIKATCELEGASEGLSQNLAAELWPNPTREALVCSFRCSYGCFALTGDKRKKRNAGVSIGCVTKSFCFSVS